MKTDIEIAKEAKMLPISQIADKLGIQEEELEFYGRFKAKINDNFLKRTADRKNGKLILVTAINLNKENRFWIMFWITYAHMLTCSCWLDLESIDKNQHQQAKVTTISCVNIVS